MEADRRPSDLEFHDPYPGGKGVCRSDPRTRTPTTTRSRLRSGYCCTTVILLFGEVLVFAFPHVKVERGGARRILLVPRADKTTEDETTKKGDPPVAVSGV